MKNVLIISQFFAPRNVIAAIRFTKMVKYLSRTGKYKFWIICIGSKTEYICDELLQRDIDNMAEYVSIIPVLMDKTLLDIVKSFKFCNDKESIAVDASLKTESEKKDIYYVIQEKFVNCRQKGAKGSAKRFFGKILIRVNDIYDLEFEWLFAVKAQKVLKQVPLEKIDVMISSYGNLGAVILASRIKRYNSHIGWIMDYRDPVTAISCIKRKVLNMAVCRADRLANYITGATPSCVGSERQMGKFHVIPNGYDLEDIITVSSKQNEKLLLCKKQYGSII